MNLVMITLDAVRPDHLGCYGYRDVETPNIDKLALEGIFCEQAVTHAPNTWVSHATLFTGCLPARHGLRTATHILHPQALTVAEWLSSHGYATAAFPGSSLVGRLQGFHRGFDLFDEQWWDEGRRVKDVLWRTNWDDTLTRAQNWMIESFEPFFLWLHYIDTHHLPEYTLPEYYRLGFSPRWQHYDGKISYADHVCIGNLVSFLENHGFRNRTCVILLSDHGEELLGDDRAVHDGGLKEDVVLVPLIISPPAELSRPATTVPEQARLLDVFPTVCDLLNLPHPQGLHGRSILTLLKGRGLDEEASIAYLENLPKGYLGVRTSEWKLILRYASQEDWGAKDPAVEGLYHLPSDPEERFDLSKKHPSVLEHLMASCLKWARAPSPQNLSPEEKEKIEDVLRRLGYL